MKSALDELREQVSEELRLLPPAAVAPLRCDRWLASSILQKAIRRGDLGTAQRAALTVLNENRSGFWRRLQVIAFEDIGIGGVSEIERVVACCDHRVRSARAADERIALYAVQLLARAPKDRSADYLLCTSRSHPALASLRSSLAAVPLAERFERLKGPPGPIIEMAATAWYCSGVEWRPETRVGPGSLGRLFDSLSGMGVPPAFLEATASAVRKTREPIVLMVPVAYLYGCCGTVVALKEVEARGDTGPLYGLDKHTRLGRAAISRFLTNNSQIMGTLSEVPASTHVEAVGLALFYAEGEQCDRRWTWPETDRLRTLGMEADFSAIGVPIETGELLVRLVEEHIGHLNVLRRDVLRASLQ